MRRMIGGGFLACCLSFVTPASGAEAEKFRQSVPEELSEAWERLQQALQDWGGRLKERFGSRESSEDRPVISQLLRYKDYLGLSPDQVKKLEQLRDSFQRQSIRNEADSRIVELDIETLLDSPTVDVGKVETKIREAEKLRADLRVARIKAIEQAKAVLTAEQRKKFSDSLESRGARAPRAGQNPSAKE